MEKYKADFIEFLLSSGAFKPLNEGPYKLKSGRMSPHFIDMGRFDDGDGSKKLGEFYAEAILHSVGAEKFDLIFGPPYKGITLAVTTSIALANRGVNKGYSFNRKEEKIHGEATGAGKNKEEIHKKMIVGHKIENGSRVVLIDDVFTTGDTKYEAVQVLNSVADNVKIQAGMIAVDRQEINEDGEAAIEQFVKDTNIPFFAVIKTSDIIDYLYETKKLSPTDESALKRYLRAWGTKEAREKYGLGKERLIEGRTVIPACDVDSIERLEEIVKATADMKKIGGYKIGLELSLYYGLPRLVEVVKNNAPDKKFIYDHQKGATDIPDLGAKFAKVCKKSGVDAVILFPQSGPRTQVAWTGECLQQDLFVLVGGKMTHPKYALSEGGNIDDKKIIEMYQRAARQGVNHFVVPGNQPDNIKLFKEVIEKEGIDSILFAPGFVEQGGKIADATKVAGDHWHAIVGRAITEAKNIRAAAEEMTSKL